MQPWIRVLCGKLVFRGMLIWCDVMVTFSKLSPCPTNLLIKNVWEILLHHIRWTVIANIQLSQAGKLILHLVLISYKGSGEKLMLKLPCAGAIRVF